MTAPANPRQLPLPMLNWYDGPVVVDESSVEACGSYREAVRACWALRKRVYMTQRQLAEETGCYAPHISDYLSADPNKRDLPARNIAAFEICCGNRLISQWVAAQSELPVLQGVVIQRKAA